VSTTSRLVAEEASRTRFGGAAAHHPGGKTLNVTPGTNYVVRGKIFFFGGGGLRACFYRTALLSN